MGTTIKVTMSHKALGMIDTGKNHLIIFKQFPPSTTEGLDLNYKLQKTKEKYDKTIKRLNHNQASVDALYQELESLGYSILSFETKHHARDFLQQLLRILE